MQNMRLRYTDWFAELADEDVLLLTLDSLYE